MKRIPIVAALALPLFAATAALAQNTGVTVTGSNGGTIQRDRSCTRSAGQAECTIQGTATTPSGEVYTRERERSRTTGDGQSASSVQATGPAGNTRTRTRLVQR